MRREHGELRAVDALGLLEPLLQLLRERVDARVGLEPHGLRLGGEVLLQQQPLLDRGIRRGRGRVRVRVC